MDIIKKILPIISTGLVIGVITVILCFSFASLIFGEQLPMFVSSGAGLMLATAIVIGLIGSLTSSFPSAIYIPQDRIVPLFAIMASAIITALPVASPEEKFYTVLTAIFIATCLTGITFLLIGAYNLSGIMRYIPYPVMGGFLAGSGWLLLKGSLPLLTGLPMDKWNFFILLEETSLLRWLPGLLGALLLYVIMRRSRNPILMPVIIVGTLALFYLGIWFKGYSVDHAMKSGWLIGYFPVQSMVKWEVGNAFANSVWHVIGLQAAHMFTIITVSVASLLLSVSVLELEGKDDLNYNRELRWVGIANILSGMAGGVIGFHSLSLTELNLQMGIRSRMTGIIAACVSLAVLITGASYLAYIPYCILGSLLFYLGLTFLIEWLYDAWFRIPLSDYLVILLILVTIGIFGYILGVAVGILTAMVLFAIQYSRINVVRASFTGTQLQSNVDRTFEAQHILADEGKKISILKLQGYLFFGTANDILESLKQVLQSHADYHTKYVVLDFGKVDGLDSSAIVAFTKMRNLSERYQFHLMLAGMNSQIEKQLRHDRIISEAMDSPSVFSDMDHALEWCEDALLETASSSQQFSSTIKDQIREIFRGAIEAEALLPFLERKEIPKGEYIIRQGLYTQDIFILESGTITVELEIEKEKSIRIRRMGPGAIVGEMALYIKGKRTASVIAAEPCVIYLLTEESLRKMTQNNPPLTLIFHEQLATILAERLASANLTLRSMTE
ncbi:MAG: SulP family inorganic anion transporter [Bacteroidota bacterium]